MDNKCVGHSFLQLLKKSKIEIAPKCDPRQKMRNKEVLFLMVRKRRFSNAKKKKKRFGGSPQTSFTRRYEGTTSTTTGGDMDT